MTILHQDLIRRQSLSEFQRKQRQISTDSTDAFKGKGKGDYQEAKVQLPGHVQPISSSYSETHEDEDEGPSHDPTASSSHDNTIPLPTTTPTSFTPGDFAQPGNSSLHKEHQNWYHHNMMMMKQNHMKQTTLLF